MLTCWVVAAIGLRLSTPLIVQPQLGGTQHDAGAGSCHGNLACLCHCRQDSLPIQRCTGSSPSPPHRPEVWTPWRAARSIRKVHCHATEPGILPRGTTNSRCWQRLSYRPTASCTSTRRDIHGVAPATRTIWRFAQHVCNVPISFTIVGPAVGSESKVIPCTWPSLRTSPRSSRHCCCLERASM